MGDLGNRLNNSAFCLSDGAFCGLFVYNVYILVAQYVDCVFLRKVKKVSQMFGE